MMLASRRTERKFAPAPKRQAIKVFLSFGRGVLLFYHFTIKKRTHGTLWVWGCWVQDVMLKREMLPRAVNESLFSVPITTLSQM
jgi:hypothetical protein